MRRRRWHKYLVNCAWSGGRADAGSSRPPQGWHALGQNHFVRGDPWAHTHIVKQDGAGWTYRCFGPAEHIPLADRGPYPTPKPAFRDARTVERILRRSSPGGRGARVTAAEARAVFARRGEDVEGAGPEELRAAYRRLAFTLHPDRRPAAEEPEATRDLVELNAAYAALTVPEKPKRRRPVRPAPGTAWRPLNPFTPGRETWTFKTPSRDFHVWRNEGQPIPRSALWAWLGHGFEATGVKSVLEHGFVRMQVREFTPHDPRDTLFSGFRDTGYSGRVVQTRTLSKEQLADPEALVDAILQHIGTTAKGWKGDPLELITQLTIQAPIGRNVGHGAIAWQAPQDAVARDFGYRTRYYSISFAPRPKRRKTIPKAKRLNRSKVEAIFRGQGFVKTNPRAWKVSKWQFPGQTRTLDTKDRHIEGVYYGQLTREKLDAMIAWAKGEGPWPRSDD